jgi:hypothetical protein
MRIRIRSVKRRMVITREWTNLLKARRQITRFGKDIVMLIRERSIRYFRHVVPVVLLGVVAGLSRVAYAQVARMESSLSSQ